MRHFLFLFVLLPCFANAQTASFSPHQVIGTVTADFDSDGGVDRAILLDNLRGDADLLLYLSSKGANMTEQHLQPSITALNIAMVSNAWGQETNLLAPATGGLQITSGNQGMGRNRWHQTLTLAFHHGQMVVTGFSYNYRDSLNLDHYGACDVDYLSGSYDLSIGDQALQHRKITLPALPVEKWTPANLPAGCF